MLLTSIQVQGFKSFADKTTLKFGKGITAVVGPNGSGKSNISDAVRWVLGEQSTKNLRGQSMEDVIFGGTAERRPHGYCEVTLNINNSDRTLNFDNDFVSVTRRYYRSHESEYLINNVSVRLKDINELFMDTGLGRDGYSMIGQGKIDTIIGSKSQERRDIFEEASGISKYRYKKSEAERKLLSAEENLIRLKDILTELETRVGPLKEQSEKAEKFLSLSQRKKELDIGLWLHLLDNSKEALSNQENKIDIANLQYNEVNNLLSEFDEKTEANSKAFADITAQIEGIRSGMSEVNEEIVRINGEISLLNNEILHKNETIERLKKQLDELKLSDESAEDEIKQKNALGEEAEKKSAALSNEADALQLELASLITDSDTISAKIETLSANVNKLLSKQADIRVSMSSITASIEEINGRHGTIDVSISKKQEEIALLNNEYTENKAYFDTVSAKMQETENALKGYELKYVSKRNTVDTLKKECEDLRLDLEAKKRRIQILKELNQNMEGFSESVKTVIRDSRKGILRGICGTVSDIIKVDKQYSVAVETALGATIQHIVTKTEADAKRAIEMLKANSSGRATFLPITSIKSRELKESGFENMFGYVGLACDLVECDNEYKEIIKYLLGNTVVCDDLDCAVTISKKFNYRLKTVSLDGQVVNAGGSLTGGSLIRNAGILSRSGDIDRLLKDSEKLENRLKEKTTLLNEAKEILAKADADINACKAEITTANEDKIRALGELKRIELSMETLKVALEELEAEKTSSTDKITSLSETLAQHENELAKIDAEKESLQNELDTVSGGRDSLADKREETVNKITATKLAAFEAQKDAQGYYAEAQNMKNAINDRAEHQANTENEIFVLKAEIDKLLNDIEIKNNEIESAKQGNTDSQARTDELIAKRAEIEKQGVEIRSSEKERTLEREKISGELARLTERKEAMLREFDDIIRNLYDEYQLSRSEAEQMGIKLENPSAAKKELAEIKASIRRLGNVNVSAIDEYKEVYERYSFMKEQLDDIEKTKSELNKLINRLTSQMQELFSIGFAKINEAFSKTFRELFGGGEAHLSLSDPNNILESGIDIDVKLPGKNVPSLDGLSGGEKALIALSIYFSIMRVNAPPFCFLDEVDTALDDINVDRFAEYMKRPDFSTQFICVTHRRGTMEAADMLYGVTMQEKGVTKLLELNVAQLEKQMLNKE